MSTNGNIILKSILVYVLGFNVTDWVHPAQDKVDLRTL